MYYNQRLWIASLAAIASMTAVTTSVTAQTNQSDTSGFQTFSAPSVSIPASGIGSGIGVTPFISSGGQIIIPTADGNIVFTPETGDLFSSGFGSTNRRATGNISGEGSGDGSDRATGDIFGEGGDDGADQDTGELSDEGLSAEDASRKITLNDVARLLEDDLDESLEQLAAAEEAVEAADKKPRRIARRSNLEENRECINPAVQVRENFNTKLKQSRRFIEQINQINPENGLW